MIVNNQKSVLAKSWGKFFLVIVAIVIALFPFANLFHVFYPAIIFGKSAWIVLPASSIGLFYLYLLIKKSISKIDIFLATIMVLFGLIFLAREFFYNEIRSILDLRYILTSSLFLAVVWHVKNDSFAIRFFSYAITIQAILVAVVRSINYYFFPNVMISYDVSGLVSEAFFNTDGSLTRDLLLSSSMSANHIVCGMFVLLALMKNNVVKLSASFFFLIQLFFLISSLNTLSRFPITIAIFLFCLTLLHLKLTSIKNILYIILIAIVLLSLTYLVELNLFGFWERFGEDGGGRADKLQIVLQLTLNSALDFLIGSSVTLIQSTVINGVIFSDNSYGQIAIQFGIPFAFLFFILLLYGFFKIKSDNLSLLFLIYVFIGLGITNCILWEPWVFTAFVGFGITSYYGRFKSPGYLQ